MAKSVETPKLLTFKKAQAYLASQGLELSTQQVRNLARSHDVVMAGVTEYVDPVTDETTRVIAQSALDDYLKWRAENPARKPTKAKRAFFRIAPHRLDELNSILAANGFPSASFVTYKPRKSRNTSSEAAIK